MQLTLLEVSTHSRLKAAGILASLTNIFDNVSTHSRLKAAGTAVATSIKNAGLFQHTAA